MKAQAAKLIPVRFSFDGSELRPDGWGRLVNLSANRGQILTRFQLEKGERLALSFELDGKIFEQVWTKVSHADADVDGYFLVELKFYDPDLRHNISDALRGILS